MTHNTQHGKFVNHTDSLITCCISDSSHWSRPWNLRSKQQIQSLSFRLNTRNYPNSHLEKYAIITVCCVYIIHTIRIAKSLKALLVISHAHCWEVSHANRLNSAWLAWRHPCNLWCVVSATLRPATCVQWVSVALLPLTPPPHPLNTVHLSRLWLFVFSTLAVLFHHFLSFLPSPFRLCAHVWRKHLLPSSLLCLILELLLQGCGHLWSFGVLSPPPPSPVFSLTLNFINNIDSCNATSWSHIPHT